MVLSHHSTNEDTLVVYDESSRNLAVKDIEKNILKSAIAHNPFFTFATLKRYFPQLTSIREFITSKDYLGGLTINLQGAINDLGVNRAPKNSRRVVDC